MHSRCILNWTGDWSAWMCAVKKEKQDVVEAQKRLADAVASGDTAAQREAEAALALEIQEAEEAELRAADLVRRHFPLCSYTLCGPLHPPRPETEEEETQTQPTTDPWHVHALAFRQ